MVKAFEKEEKNPFPRISAALGKTKYVKKRTGRSEANTSTYTLAGVVSTRAVCIETPIATRTHIYMERGGAVVIGRRVEAISRHDGCLAGVAVVASLVFLA